MFQADQIPIDIIVNSDLLSDKEYFNNFKWLKKHRTSVDKLIIQKLPIHFSKFYKVIVLK